MQAESRDDLRAKLQVASGGVVFTTIQKFLPDEQGRALSAALATARNIVVIADEAHRSQYDFIDGFARHMRDALPNASFIGFTGTPIELTDKNTRAVFGDYIDVYDIQRAVEDGATVPIYYEGRLAKLDLDEAEKPQDRRGVRGGHRGRGGRAKREAQEQVGARSRRWSAPTSASRWSPRTWSSISRTRQAAMERQGDGRLHEPPHLRRPLRRDRQAAARHVARTDDDDEHGAIKVVMTGSASDPLAWQRAHPQQGTARGPGASASRTPTTPSSSSSSATCG